jgi:hypothetical protein
VVAVDNQGLDVTGDSQQYQQSGDYYQQGGDYQDGECYQQEGDYQQGGFYQTDNGSYDDSLDYEPYEASNNQQVPRDTTAIVIVHTTYTTGLGGGTVWTCVSMGESS